MTDMIKRNRKFTLAVFAICVSALALFTGKIDGSIWMGSIAFILGLYGTANIMSEKNKNDKDL